MLSEWTQITGFRCSEKLFMTALPMYECKIYNNNLKSSMDVTQCAIQKMINTSICHGFLGVALGICCYSVSWLVSLSLHSKLQT